MGLEKVIQQLTDVPARLYGIRERGRIEVGYHADLVAFDPSEVGPDRMGARRDLPGDTARVVCGRRRRCRCVGQRSLSRA